MKIEIKPVGTGHDAAGGGGDMTDEALEEEAEAHKEENWPHHAPRKERRHRRTERSVAKNVDWLISLF